MKYDDVVPFLDEEAELEATRVGVNAVSVGS